MTEPHTEQVSQGPALCPHGDSGPELCLGRAPAGCPVSLSSSRFHTPSSPSSEKERDNNSLE